MKALSIIRVDHVGKNPHIQFPQKPIENYARKDNDQQFRREKIGFRCKTSINRNHRTIWIVEKEHGGIEIDCAAFTYRRVEDQG